MSGFNTGEMNQAAVMYAMEYLIVCRSLKIIDVRAEIIWQHYAKESLNARLIRRYVISPI